MSLCLSVCACAPEYMFVQAELTKITKGVRSPWSRVSEEVSYYTGTGKQTLVLCKSSECSTLLSHLPGPLVYLLLYILWMKKDEVRKYNRRGNTSLIFKYQIFIAWSSALTNCMKWWAFLQKSSRLRASLRQVYWWNLKFIIKNLLYINM